MEDNRKSSGLNRRRFATSLVSGAAAATAEAQQSESQRPPSQAPAVSFRPLVPDTPPFDGPLEYNRGTVARKAEPFPMGQVKLLPNSTFSDAQEWNSGYMQRLAADRLLYTFRVNAGLPTGSSRPLGGWEQPENGQRSSELRGHFGGHFLSALAQRAVNGDTEAQQEGEYMVAELAKCQAKLGGQYLSAFPTSWFDRLEKGERVWAPFYTIHKIMAGLYDNYRLTNNKQALSVLEGMAAWADRWTASKPLDRMQQMLTIEFGGIAETLYHLAAATGNDQWARTGDRFQKRSFINPLASGRDELRGLHVNTHVPQVIAAARRYEISGDQRFRDVAEYFYREVTTARAYVTGGTSNAEAWLAPPHRLAGELKMSVNTTECCCAYNMLKLARQLYSWDPDPKYFDYYERVLLNHRIGTIRPNTGNTQYYLGLAPGSWKTFNTDDQTFWCCTGSGVEEYSKLNDSIYWRDNRGIYVNLFIPSELDWVERRLRLKQEACYPQTETIAFTVSAAPPDSLAIRLRVPGWLRAEPPVKLNGRALDVSASPGSYLSITRVWNPGDRIELEFPMHLTAEAMPDDNDLRAFMYGPLVLAGDLGNEGLTEAHIVGPNLRIGYPGIAQSGSALDQINRVPPIGSVEVPEFRGGSADPSSWIKPEGPLTFRTTGQAKDVTMVPLNRLFDKRYSVYWRVV